MPSFTPKPLPLATIDERLRISYSSPSGLRWKRDAGQGGRIKAGSVAGSRNKRGYWRIRINGKDYPVHRIFYYLKEGVDPSPYLVDHVDRENKDNRVELRLVTDTESILHRGKHKTANGKPTSSKYRGVTWDNHRKKWMARIMIDGKQIHLGRFTSERDAARAYDAAAEKYPGSEFRELNRVLYPEDFS